MHLPCISGVMPYAWMHHVKEASAWQGKPPENAFCLCNTDSSRPVPVANQCAHIKLRGCVAAALLECWRKQYHRHLAKILEQLDTGKHHHHCGHICINVLQLRKQLSNLALQLSRLAKDLLMQVRELDFSGNHLEGSLPDTWSNLTTVRL